MNNIETLRVWSKNNGLEFRSPSIPVDPAPGEEYTVGLWFVDDTGYEMVRLDKENDEHVYVDLFNGEGITRMTIAELTTRRLIIDTENFDHKLV